MRSYVCIHTSRLVQRWVVGVRAQVGAPAFCVATNASAMQRGSRRLDEAQHEATGGQGAANTSYLRNDLVQGQDHKA
jgi:hypothetical protein